MGPPLGAEEREKRPIFAKFMDAIAAAKVRYMGEGHSYWHLSMMVRDPSKPALKGAVRAVIEPYLRKAEEDGLPVWIEASSARARDVYAYMGFELLEEYRSGEGSHRADAQHAMNGEDAPGVPIWFMIKWPKRGKDEAANGTIPGA